MQSILRAVATVAMVTLGACADLSAIKQFSQVSADGAAYQKITADYVSAPVRERRYLLAGDPALRQSIDARADARKSQAVQLAAFHAVVEAYMKALGDLAADSVPNYDKEVGALVTSGASVGLIPKDLADPLTTLASLAARAATEAYRQRKLAEVIQQADPALQATLERTRVIVGQGMRQDVDIEEDMFTFHYKYLERQARGTEPVSAQLVREVIEERGGQFEPRRKAIAAYLDVLDGIAKGHANLARNVTRLSATEVLTETKMYTDKIYSALKAIQAAKQ